MIRGLLIAVPLLLFAGCGGGDSRPSILLVTIDTLRYDAVGCNGGVDADTPRIDGLAAEGVRFTRAQTNCPLTLPSHTTILTGLLPPQHGFRDNDPPAPLPPPEHRSFKTLAERLAASGYATGAFVSASVLAARTGLAYGFDRYEGPNEGVAGELTYAEQRGDATAAAAKSWLETIRRRPFFLWVHFFDPHDPYEPPTAFRTGAQAGSRAAYLSEVSYADACVGMLLDALRENGVAENTLVILTSDHGEGLSEHGEPTHGYLLNETTLRVPLIMRWPGHLDAGEIRRELVGLVDLTPTLLDAAGIEPGGSSLLEPGSERAYVAETLYGYRQMGWAQLFSSRIGDEKLTVGLDGAGARRFDLNADPGEENPLTGDRPEHKANISRYRVLEPMIRDAGEVSPEVRGLPYASGLGRARLLPLPLEENAKLRAPDPAFAAEVDRQKSLIGKVAPGVVEAGLADLARKDPQNPSLPFWRGRNFMAADDPARAYPHFADAFELGLADARVLSLWIRCLLLSGELEKASQLVETETAEVVPDTGLWLMMASVHLARNELEKADHCEVQALRSARTNRERELVSRFRHNLSTGNDK